MPLSASQAARLEPSASDAQARALGLKSATRHDRGARCTEALTSDISEPSSTGEARSSNDPRRPLGRRGEDLAVAHFKRLGFEEVARNQQTRFGEIDLIVCDEKTLVFVEVKTRHTRDGSGRPQSSPERTLGWPSIRQYKRHRSLVYSWLTLQGSKRPRARDMRLDVVKVLFDKNDQLVRLDHIQAAWEGAW